MTLRRSHVKADFKHNFAALRSSLPLKKVSRLYSSTVTQFEFVSSKDVNIIVRVLVSSLSGLLQVLWLKCCCSRVR